MEATSAVEDYLKTIFTLRAEGEPATTGAIATRLGVSAPSVSGMVKRLETSELAARSGDRSVHLTAEGRALALRTIRRHRLLETFLVEVLGVGWEAVHAEAEQLEHALSEALCDRIDDYLGNPTHDPHGDPIPPRTGPHAEDFGTPLGGLPTGARFVVERVSDRSSEALRYLGEKGIRPGATLTVTGREPFGGPTWVRVDGADHALGAQLCQMVHGRPDAR
jgi:DtxR family Mn-dependent transcriptional regulator